MSYNKKITQNISAHLLWYIQLGWTECISLEIHHYQLAQFNVGAWRRSATTAKPTSERIMNEISFWKWRQSRIPFKTVFICSLIRTQAHVTFVSFKIWCAAKVSIRIHCDSIERNGFSRFHRCNAQEFQPSWMKWLAYFVWQRQFAFDCRYFRLAHFFWFFVQSNGLGYAFQPDSICIDV